MSATSETSENIEQITKSRINKALIKEYRDHVLILKINRLEAKNALNRSAIYELMAAIGEATHNDNVHIVVVTGVGDIFTAGNDLKQILKYKSPEDYFFGATYIMKAFVKTIIACPKVLVCLVNGPCLGIGFTFAALCDAVYCTQNAYFQAPFTKLGICPESGGSATFPQHFSGSWVTNLLLFGERLSAAKAMQLGFVVNVYDDQAAVNAKFWPKMYEYAKLPWDSMRISKRLVQQHLQQSLQLALNEECKELRLLHQGKVYQQSMIDFAAKSRNKSKL